MPIAQQRVTCPVLIGRDAPLATGLHALTRARDARGETLLLSGEAGIGKSRLVAALLAQARTLGFVTLEGACFEADRTQPYAPVLDLVRVLSATTSPALAAHALAPAAVELVTYFPELQSLFPEAVPRAGHDPDENRRRLFSSVTDALHALTRVQPVALVIEDIHWSDDATLDLLQHLARHLASTPALLLLTFRSDEIGPRLARLLADLDRTRRAAEVSLRALEPPEIAAMLEAIFSPPVAFEQAFVERLHHLTEGNPFFVEEMLKGLLVTGGLERVDEAWRVQRFDQAPVPRTAIEAVGRRLAGLTVAARRIASIAAVAGRRFDFALLQVLTGHAEGELLALVKSLVEAQLVVEESADRFAFRHALTREALRAQLLERERVALHGAIAGALAARQGEGVEIGDAALAYHAYEAGHWEAARRHAERAATQALALCAPREALLQFERAATASTKLGQRPEPSLLVARGRAHETLGSFAQADADFREALAAARQDGHPRAEWEALHALGLLWAARDYARAGRYRREALAAARAIDDPVLLARSLNRVGNWHVNRDDPQAGIPHHDEALEIFERAGDQRGIAETLDLLAMAHHIGGTQGAAVPLYERAIELFTALNDRRGEANALAVLGVCGPSHHASAGPVVVARQLQELLGTERAVRLATEIGWRAGEAFSRYLLADALAWRGEYRRALRLAREALVIAEEMAHLEWQGGARRVLGVIALDLGASDEALVHLELAHRCARELGSITWQRWTAAPLAIALASSGDWTGAVHVLDAADALVPEGQLGATALESAGGTLGVRQLAVARAEVALVAGRPAEALERLRADVLVGVPRVALLRGRALAALRRWDEATLAIEAAREGAHQQGARSQLWRIAAAQGAVQLGQRRRRAARQSFDAAREMAATLVDELEEPGLIASFRASMDLLAPPPPVPTAARAAKAAHGGLTRRERETAGLVALGRTNRAIAEALGIGERTVEGYVAAALAKLGFASRAQLAVWADGQGLAARQVPRAPRRS